MAKPANTALAGGNDCKIYGSGTRNMLKRLRAYQADGLSEKGACGKRMQDVDYGLEGLHNLAIVASEFEESLRLFLENGGNGLNRVAFYQLRIERMVNQPCPCLFSVVFQGSLEERSKLRCTRLIAHIPSRRMNYG